MYLNFASLNLADGEQCKYGGNDELSFHSKMRKVKWRLLSPLVVKKLYFIMNSLKK